MALWGNKKPEPEGNGKVLDTMYGKPPPAVEPVQPTVPTPMPIAPAFGIDQTISLMRSLPANKDPLLVVAVMKATLEHLVHCCKGDERPDCPILENLAEERREDLPTVAKPRGRPGFAQR